MILRDSSSDILTSADPPLRRTISATAKGFQGNYFLRMMGRAPSCVFGDDGYAP